MAVCLTVSDRSYCNTCTQELESYTEGLDISEAQPWLLQQFLRGPEYASYSIVAGSNVIAHVDNEAELSCLNYAHVGQSEVRCQRSRATPDIWSRSLPQLISCPNTCQTDDMYCGMCCYCCL